MGISRDQFWRSSVNGRAMVLMLAQRGTVNIPGTPAGAGDVELVHDILDWLVVQRELGIKSDALREGRSEDAAKIIARDRVAGLQGTVDSISDHNVVGVVNKVIDEVFMTHYGRGPVEYAKVMHWFADKLREKVK